MFSSQPDQSEVQEEVQYGNQILRFVLSYQGHPLEQVSPCWVAFYSWRVMVGQGLLLTLAEMELVDLFLSMGLVDLGLKHGLGWADLSFLGLEARVLTGLAVETLINTCFCITKTSE